MLLAREGEIPLRDVCFLQHQDSVSSVGVAVKRRPDGLILQGGRHLITLRVLAVITMLRSFGM